MLEDGRSLHTTMLGLPRSVALFLILVVGLAILAVDTPVWAQKQKTRRGGAKAAQSGVQDFSSPHFLIHTDMSQKEAAKLLKDLETELKLIATYWGRRPSGVIECYVAKDIETWPSTIQAAMEPEGLSQIRDEAGICITRTLSVGNRFVAKSVVYAVAKEGVPLHEAVHGYCGQTFGRAGPQWYAEGMAELGHYWINGKKGVNAFPVVIEYLKKGRPRPLESLIIDVEELGGTWQDYAWWWLLCHLLENNPNYSAAFRALGPELLMGKDTGFRQIFGAQIRELKFEFKLLRDHLETGYRVDLCYWDWRKKFSSLTTQSRPYLVTLQANRGWQPSGVTVAADTEYAYSVTGTWRTAKDAEPVTAKGADDGTGRLVGVIMKDYKLGEEFELGDTGTFTAPADGNLYLRCRTDWAKVGDASGRVAAKFKVATASKPTEEK